VVAAAAPITYDSITQTVGLGVAPAGIATANINDGVVTAAKIANRTRRFVVPSGAFQSDSNSGITTGMVNAGVGQWRNRAAASRLPNTDQNVTTATFVVPADYVAGQPVPQITVYWGTNEGGGDRRPDIDVSFDAVTDITGWNDPVTFRYNFRAGGSGAHAMEALNPAQGAIVAQVIPEAGDSFQGAPSWNPGDVIIISIGRNGPSGADPNNGDVFIYGIAVSYEADQ
jgi:hypothetical protein